MTTINEKPANSVTRETIESKIAGVMYMNGADMAKANGMNIGHETENNLKRLTLCVVVMENGFLLTGESACVSADNYDEATGKRIAFENATNKMWPLLGYALREELFKASLV